MPFSSCVRMRLFSWTVIGVICTHAALTLAGEAAYFWKPNDVLRFEYAKTIDIEEETAADEVFNDRPAALNQSTVDIIEFTAPADTSDRPHLLGTSKVIATAKLGEKLLITGLIKEDERHAKFVEVKNPAGVTGFVPGTTKVRDTREFSFDAILIIEVKNRTPTGTFGILHFDSAHIIMPESYWFSAQADDPAVQKDRAKAILHAMEGAIKLARWNVILDPDGVVHIDTRVPKGLDDWLKETEHAAFWRGKFRKLWMDIVDKNLGLAATGDDHEMLLSLKGAAAAPTAEMEKIRPFRAAAELVKDKLGKLEYKFRRLPPPQAGTAYKLPYIGPPDDPKTPSILMTFKVPINGPLTETDPVGAQPQIGTAIFDTKLGMLDGMNEGYSFETEYTCEEDKRRHYRVTQKVSVTYSLKRLAPPILGRIEQAVEAPLKQNK